MGQRADSLSSRLMNRQFVNRNNLPRNNQLGWLLGPKNIAKKANSVT